MPETTHKKVLSSPQAKIQKALFITLLFSIFGRYIGSTGISDTSTFTLNVPEILILVAIYLGQAIPLYLMRVTRNNFFKACFLVSQIIAFLNALPGLSYMAGTVIYGGIFERLNQLAALTCIWSMLVSTFLFFYVKNSSIDYLVTSPTEKN